MNTQKQAKISSDSDLIDAMGGVSALANKLGYSLQRVFNWKTRGIPPYVKLEHQDLFQKNKPSVKDGADKSA